MMNVDIHKLLSIRQAVFKCRMNILCIGIALIIYCFNKLILINISSGLVGCFFRCYLNDLVCPLFFLGYCQILFLWVGYELFSYKSCLFLGMSAGIVWEYFAPVINTRAVSDSLDLLCYFIGINIYVALIRFDQRAKTQIVKSS